MKHKVLLLALTMFLVLALVGCNLLRTTTPEPEEPVEVLSAKVRVTDWEQGYECTIHPHTGVHTHTPADTIDIDYKITNTGTMDIDSSRILFEVTYKDKSDVYLVWIDGVGVDVNCYKSAEAKEVAIQSRKVAAVFAVDWELVGLVYEP